MVCTGAKSEKLARRAVNRVVRELKDGGILIMNKPKTVIQNIVASANLQHNIDLELAADLLGVALLRMLMLDLGTSITVGLIGYCSLRGSGPLTNQK